MLADMNDFEQRAERSQTTVVKTVFPHTTNHVGTLFGGTALQWMDEVAFITATRFSRQEYVTVSLDRTDFKKPIPAGTIVELVGRVVRVGTTSLQVRVDVHCEKMFAEGRALAISGQFTMVAVGADRRPTRIV